MKKIQLSIPTPCHESWEAMKPEDKGKFCGSCQKTVIDFTSMSDRQIAEFFKKPIGSTCGRFHNDQLERPIEIPKKRIPWVRYFFTVTWPAFMLMLKSCGQREDMMGKMRVDFSKESRIDDERTATLGVMMPEITPVDSVQKTKKVKAKIEEIKTQTVGLITEPFFVEDEKDTVTKPLEPTIESLPKETLFMDTVSVSASNYKTCKIFMGQLNVVKVDRIKKDSVMMIEKAQQKIEAFAYPNPIKAGGQLTVLVNKNDDAIKQIQLFSSSGAVIPVQRNGSSNDKRLILTVPSSVAAGTYFLRIVSKNAQASTVKIVVLN